MHAHNACGRCFMWYACFSNDLDYCNVNKNPKETAGVEWEIPLIICTCAQLINDAHLISSGQLLQKMHSLSISHATCTLIAYTDYLCFLSLWNEALNFETGPGGFNMEIGRELAEVCSTGGSHCNQSKQVRYSTIFGAFYIRLLFKCFNFIIECCGYFWTLLHWLKSASSTRNWPVAKQVLLGLFDDTYQKASILTLERVWSALHSSRWVHWVYCMYIEASKVVVFEKCWSFNSYITHCIPF